ncbi:MAG: hypothetical protein V1725_00755 [archaeon]
MLRIGLNRAENEKYETYYRQLADRTEKLGLPPERTSELLNEASLAILRDIQAQRLPPNVRVPSRKHVLNYLRTMYEATGDPFISALSLVQPGSWTSSGGSFKLAELAGYDIPEELMRVQQEKGQARYLEIGAGYAGFKFDEPKGVAAIAARAGYQLGKTIHADFTNVTKWHDSLPAGIHEHPGYFARDVSSLFNALPPVDIIYSQAAAYFEQMLESYLHGTFSNLNPGGLLLFNAKPQKDDLVVWTAKQNGMQLEKKLELGQENGNVYALRKGAA